MRRGRVGAGLMLAVALLLAGPVAGRELVLEDLLNKQWTSEPVSFALEAAAGECHVESVRLRGPEGPVAAQLSEVETWAGTPFLRTGKLWFVTDLQPRERRVFTVESGAAPAGAAPPAEDLQVRQGEGVVEFGTAAFGVRLLVGERTFEPPVPAGEAPGPIRALRLADGTWFGGSEMYGEGAVRSYAAQVTGEGPAFGRVEYRYEYEDGNVLEGSVTLYARAQFAVLHTNSREDRPEEGFRLLLSPGLPPLTLHVQRLGGWDAPFDFAPEVGPYEWAQRPLRGVAEGVIVRLTPWADWFWNTTVPTIRLGLDEARELQISRRHAGRWVEPAAPGTMRRWEGWSHKMLDLKASEEGEIYLSFNNAQGERHLQIGEQAPDESVGWKPLRDTLGRPHGAQVTPETLRLDEVKEYVLDWPESGERHPRLFMSREEVEAMWERFRRESPPHLQELIERGRVYRRGPPTPAYHTSPALSAYLASAGDAALAEELRLVEGLEWQLGLLGKFDRMRQTEEVASYYDMLIDSGLIEEENKRVLRAQMALVAYQLADPSTWSIERGYRSYNPNMSVSYTLALGVVACLLRDHPKAEEWLEAPVRMMHQWLRQNITPHGEWLESAHYAQVSAGDFLSFAVAAKHAGVHDFFTEEPLRRLGLYLAQQYTPADPRHMNRRVTPTVGRGTAGMAWGHFGVLARATRDTAPEYSALMQWMWEQTNYATGMVKLGGYQDLYGDRTLPTRQPEWGTERFPNVSVIFRNGMGHPNEHYLNFLAVSDTFGTVRPQEIGSVVGWFAHGKPVSMAFNQPEDFRMHRLMNQVTPAEPDDPDSLFRGENRGPRRTVARHLGFARLSLADYAAATYQLGPPWGGAWNLPGLPRWPEAGQATDRVNWQRQMLFLRDDDPGGVHYLVLNDTILNEQPTRWHFWTLSEKLDTTERAREEGFLADAPGAEPVEGRELPGDRFTAVGQYGVDLDMFVAAPEGTPRHTLRYGGRYEAYAVRVEEYQDLLHLQMPGRGRYFVALFPRPTAAPPPNFERLAEGKILRVSGSFGTDYVLLSEARIEAADEAGGVAFDTGAGAVRVRPFERGLALILAGEGSVSSGETTLAADGPAELRRVEERWTLRVDAGQEATVWNVQTWDNVTKQTLEPLERVRVEIRHPGAERWALPGLPAGVQVEREAGRLVLVIPRGVSRLTLTGG